jgi:hypothetical protein
MIQRKIDSKKFDEVFQKLLEEKKGKDVVKGRFDIEQIEFDAKLDFIFHLLLSDRFAENFTYKILFWEEISAIQRLIDNYKVKTYNVAKLYENGEQPGVIFIDDEKLYEAFLRELLTNHFNYELAKEPRMNLRVQVCISHKDYTTLLDIYDDRGFDIYYLERP